MKGFAIVQMFIHNINVVRLICDHLLGDNHTHGHRMAVGGAVMVVGVYIAKSLGHSEVFFVQMGADLFGYLVHGIGAVPYVDSLITAIKPNTQESAA